MVNMMIRQYYDTTVGIREALDENIFNLEVIINQRTEFRKTHTHDKLMEFVLCYKNLPVILLARDGKAYKMPEKDIPHLENAKRVSTVEKFLKDTEMQIPYKTEKY